MNNAIIECLVEIPAKSYYKYEIKNGKVYLDRPIKIPYPANYGYVTNTLAHDGDPLDIFVISSSPIPSNVHVKVEIIAGFNGLDNNIHDPKLIGLLVGDEVGTIKYTNDVESVDDIIYEIEQFLYDYKEEYKVTGRMMDDEIQTILTNSQFIHRISLNPELKR